MYITILLLSCLSHVDTLLTPSLWLSKLLKLSLLENSSSASKVTRNKLFQIIVFQVLHHSCWQNFFFFWAGKLPSIISIIQCPEIPLLRFFKFHFSFFVQFYFSWIFNIVYHNSFNTCFLSTCNNVKKYVQDYLIEII